MKKQISTTANATEYKALDKRACELVGCCENSQEEAELEESPTQWMPMTQWFGQRRFSNSSLLGLAIINSEERYH